LFLAFLGMQARGGKLHLESLALGAVQATKRRRSPAPRGPGWPRNANQTHPKLLLMPSCFNKLLEIIFSYFAKIKWMPSYFAKLLELLCVWYFRLPI
jgi:hypothetical protein